MRKKWEAKLKILNEMQMLHLPLKLSHSATVLELWHTLFYQFNLKPFPIQINSNIKIWAKQLRAPSPPEMIPARWMPSPNPTPAVLVEMGEKLNSVCYKAGTFLVDISPIYIASASVTAKSKPHQQCSFKWGEVEQRLWTHSVDSLGQVSFVLCSEKGPIFDKLSYFTDFSIV